MTDFEKQAVVLALRRMFTDSYFNICTVDACVKVVGCIPPRDMYNALSAIHCAKWADMTPEFRDEVKRNVILVLSEPTIDLSMLDGFYMQQQIEDIKPKKKLFGLIG